MGKILGIISVFMWVNSIFAMDAREIMVNNDYAGKVLGWQAQSKMVLIDKKGGERIRVGKVINKLQKNSVDYKRLYRFYSPQDIRGTGILTIEHSESDHDMWIYLPALKKTRRIISRNTRDSFMNSDFSYGDIASPKIDDFIHILKGEEKIKGIDCFIVESTSKDDRIKRDTGYSKKVLWIRKDNFVEMKIEYYDEENELLKTQFISDLYLSDLGKKRWLATKREIINHKTGHRTIITFENIEIDKGIRDDVFTTGYLERIE
ncbi:MAG: outer membrane lipoprotein-sorting protein [bacterium]